MPMLDGVQSRVWQKPAICDLRQFCVKGVIFVTSKCDWQQEQEIASQNLLIISNIHFHTFFHQYQVSLPYIRSNICPKIDTNCVLQLDIYSKPFENTYEEALTRWYLGTASTVKNVSPEQTNLCLQYAASSSIFYFLSYEVFVCKHLGLTLLVGSCMLLALTPISQST